jgi:hypothetical protein
MTGPSTPSVLRGEETQPAEKVVVNPFLDDEVLRQIGADVKQYFVLHVCVAAHHTNSGEKAEEGIALLRCRSPTRQ